MGEYALRRTLPAWVEPDPLRGRALDALGLQGTADRIADEILPGLSVLTSRARYYAVLAWARKICGSKPDEYRIHRVEVALAVREAKLHTDESRDESDRCRFVGSRNLAGPRFAVPPADPRDAYRVPVWRAYRASMRNLGLLDGDDELTDEGTTLARRFAAACGPKDHSGKTMLPASACLSAIGPREGMLIEGALGVQKKGRLGAGDTSHTARRAALERELRHLFDDGLSLSSVLATYEARRGRAPSRTVGALREAAVWERLSVGLHATFLLYLHHLAHPRSVKQMICSARRTRASGWLPFNDIAIDDETANHAIRSIRRALDLRDRLTRYGALLRCDSKAFELGEALVSSKTPIEDALAELEERHIAAKQDDAWLRDGRHGKELARDAHDKWKVPTIATLHGYRLGAFGQILVDLRGARQRRV